MTELTDEKRREDRARRKLMRRGMWLRKLRSRSSHDPAYYITDERSYVVGSADDISELEAYVEARHA